MLKLSIRRANMKYILFIIYCFIVKIVSEQSHRKSTPSDLSFVTSYIGGVGQPIPFQIYMKNGKIVIQELLGDDVQLDEVQFLSYVDGLPGLSPSMREEIKEFIRINIFPAHEGTKRQPTRTDEDSETILTSTEPNRIRESSGDRTKPRTTGRPPTGKESEIIPKVSPESKTKGEEYENRGRSAQPNEETITEQDVLKYHADIFVEGETEAFCSGAILRQRVIVTLASCVYRNSTMLDHLTVKIGPQEIPITKIIFFNKHYLKPNDIAILRLKDQINSIKFRSFSFYEKDEIQTGSSVRITSSKCKNLKDLILTGPECRRSFRNKKGNVCRKISRLRKSVDPCVAIPGSPVVQDGNLVGIVVESIAGEPTEFVNLNYYYDWLFFTSLRHNNNGNGTGEYELESGTVVQIKCEDDDKSDNNDDDDDDDGDY